MNSASETFSYVQDVATTSGVYRVRRLGLVEIFELAERHVLADYFREYEAAKGSMSAESFAEFSKEWRERRPTGAALQELARVTCLSANPPLRFVRAVLLAAVGKDQAEPPQNDAEATGEIIRVALSRTPGDAEKKTVAT